MPKSSILSELVRSLASRRRFILLTTMLLAAASIAIVFTFPRYYASSTTILPPRSGGMLGGLGEVSSLVKQFSPLKGIGGLSSGTTDLYNYLSIIRSRPTLERVVRSFDLMTVYAIGNHSMEKASKALLDNIDCLVNEEGTLTIRVWDTDARRAARIADSLVLILDEINISFNTKQAHANRVFIEERLRQNRADIDRMSDSLKRFQEKNGVAVMPQETASSISGFAQLYGMKAMKELQIGLLKQTMSADNIVLQSAQQELAEINRQLGTIPELGASYFRLYRDFMVQQKIFEVLTPLYEQARIEEKKDTPTLLVLEPANIPERPLRPKRVVIVLILTVLGFLAAWGVAFAQERIRRMKDSAPEDYQHLHGIWIDIRRLFSIRSRA